MNDTINEEKELELLNDSLINKEEEIVELSSQMPFMLETELVKRGAKFSSAAPWKEKVVVDGRLITGQNPASAAALGVEIVNKLK